MKKKVLILSFTDATRDPRVYRQLQTLNEEYQLTVIGFGDPGMDGVAYFPVSHHPSTSIAERCYRATTLLLGKYEPYLHGRYRVLAEEAWDARYDCVIVNDLEPLPLGFALSKGAPVVFDAHEYYPEESADWKRRFFFQRPSYNLCEKWLSACAAMMTVSEGLAKKYCEEFQVNPLLVYNTPYSCELPMKKVKEDTIRIIHHGGASRARKLEKMIELVPLLDKRFHLDLMLVPSDPGYLEELQEKGKRIPRLRFIAPVPMPEIATKLNSYDIGLYLLEPSCFNEVYALPNKFFEFIQARLCLAVSPTQGMGPFVKKHGLGVVSEDFSMLTMATALNALSTDDIFRYKHNSDTASRIFNGEVGAKIIRDTVVKVIAGT